MKEERIGIMEELEQIKLEYSTLKEDLEKERIINKELMESAFKANVKTIMNDKKISLIAGAVAAVALLVIGYLYSTPMEYLVILEIFVFALIAANIIFYKKYDLDQLPFSDVLTSSKIMRNFRKAYTRMIYIVWAVLIMILIGFCPKILAVWSTPLKAWCAIGFLSIAVAVGLAVEYRYSKKILECCDGIIKRLDDFKEQ